LIRTSVSTNESNWETVQEVWRTAHGYVFFGRYERVMFFLPTRLFPDQAARGELDSLLAQAGVVTCDH
jgi:hypothetical protein